MYIILFCWRHDFHFDEPISYSLFPGDNDNIAIFIEHLFSEKRRWKILLDQFTVINVRDDLCVVFNAPLHIIENFTNLFHPTILHLVMQFFSFRSFHSFPCNSDRGFRDRVILCTDGLKELNSAHRYHENRRRVCAMRVRKFFSI